MEGVRQGILLAVLFMVILLILVPGIILTYDAIRQYELCKLYPELEKAFSLWYGCQLHIDGKWINVLYVN